MKKAHISDFHLKDIDFLLSPQFSQITLTGIKMKYGKYSQVHRFPVQFLIK